MRLLHRPPETTPSLETWLGRDVPHERELASELLEKMGREKSLETLLALHDREETKREKQRCCLNKTQLISLFLSLVTICFLSLPLYRDGQPLPPP